MLGVAISTRCAVTLPTCICGRAPTVRRTTTCCMTRTSSRPRRCACSPTGALPYLVTQTLPVLSSRVAFPPLPLGTPDGLHLACSSLRCCRGALFPLPRHLPKGSGRCAAGCATCSAAARAPSPSSRPPTMCAPTTPCLFFAAPSTPQHDRVTPPSGCHISVDLRLGAPQRQQMVPDLRHVA